MVDWTAFLIVLVTSIVSGCLVVALFSLGLRLAAATGRWRRALSVASFAGCALAILYGVYLIIPALHP
ncbi:MAG: hypothetical protein JWM49_122 [Microbacteriaceae bacterium]|nr:hypothetical protein [Microbacteriaceae bacterium]